MHIGSLKNTFTLLGPLCNASMLLNNIYTEWDVIILCCRFAGEVFHGLQEQVMATASRSRNVMARVKHIEAALPSLEKAILAQTSHIHFAYTAGMTQLLPKSLIT